MLFSDLTIRNLLAIDQKMKELVEDSTFDCQTKNFYIARFFQNLGDLFAGRCAARQDLLKGDREKMIQYTVLCYSACLYHFSKTNYGNSEEKARQFLFECENAIILDYIRTVYRIENEISEIISDNVCF